MKKNGLSAFFIPDYTKRTGICGFVTNPTDQIVRKDCADQVLAGPHIH
jgi:hypothetical protein